jgi:hypothetical protein
MHAELIEISGLEDNAISHLQRNLRLCCPEIHDRVMLSTPILEMRPKLIAFNAIEIDRITDFAWSPYYAGTDIYSAIQEDPVSVGCGPDDILVSKFTTLMQHDSALVMPHAFAREADPFLTRQRQRFFVVNDRIYFFALGDVIKSGGYDPLLASVSVANSVETGFVTGMHRIGDYSSTEATLTAILNDVRCVFTSALDGEGYLVWSK